MIESCLFDKPIHCVFQDNLLQDDDNILLEDRQLSREITLPPEPSDIVMGMLKSSVVYKLNRY